MTARLPAFVAALCALLAAGCSVPAQTAPLATETSTPPPRPTKAYTVEQLAETIGCTPAFQGKAADFRQAGCEAGGADYVLLDFATEQGKGDWLDYALPYGSPYLVGERWILTSSSREAMTDLHGKLGGAIEQDLSMSGGAGGHDMGGTGG